MGAVAGLDHLMDAEEAAHRLDRRHAGVPGAGNGEGQHHQPKETRRLRRLQQHDRSEQHQHGDEEGRVERLRHGEEGEPDGHRVEGDGEGGTEDRDRAEADEAGIGGDPEHEEHAEAAFAFLTDEPMGGAVAHLSEEYPDLEVRYAWLRHHGEGRDTAEGGLWKAGNRIAKRHHDVEAVRADVQQLADLVDELETLEV